MTDLDKIDAILDWQMKAIIEAALTQDLTGKKIQITEELVKKHRGVARQAIADLLVEARVEEIAMFQDNLQHSLTDEQGRYISSRYKYLIEGNKDEWQ